MNKLITILCTLILAGCSANDLRVEPRIPCKPIVELLEPEIEDEVAFYYGSAYDTLKLSLNRRPASMCGVKVRVLRWWSSSSVYSWCDSRTAAACYWKTHMGPPHPDYIIVYNGDTPQHLRHEWLHVLLRHSGVDSDFHHAIMNRLRIYYYPNGVQK